MHENTKQTEDSRLANWLAAGKPTARSSTNRDKAQIDDKKTKFS